MSFLLLFVMLSTSPAPDDVAAFERRFVPAAVVERTPPSGADGWTYWRVGSGEAVLFLYWDGAAIGPREVTRVQLEPNPADHLRVLEGDLVPWGELGVLGALAPGREASGSWELPWGRRHRLNVLAEDGRIVQSTLHKMPLP
jgi:hypothetical protein